MDQGVGMDRINRNIMECKGTVQNAFKAYHVTY